jgi:hypothetical protein
MLDRDPQGFTSLLSKQVLLIEERGEEKIRFETVRPLPHGVRFEQFNLLGALAKGIVRLPDASIHADRLIALMEKIAESSASALLSDTGCSGVTAGCPPSLAGGYIPSFSGRSACEFILAVHPEMYDRLLALNRRAGVRSFGIEAVTPDQVSAWAAMPYGDYPYDSHPAPSHYLGALGQLERLMAEPNAAEISRQLLTPPSGEFYHQLLPRRLVNDLNSRIFSDERGYMKAKQRLQTIAHKMADVGERKMLDLFQKMVNRGSW